MVSFVTILPAYLLACISPNLGIRQLDAYTYIVTTYCPINYLYKTFFNKICYKGENQH
jgi:hypothetical protein